MPQKKFKGQCPTECPVSGDVYVCSDCKFTVTVAKGCTCTDCECVYLACCDKPMIKVN